MFAFPNNGLLKKTLLYRSVLQCLTGWCAISLRSIVFVLFSSVLFSSGAHWSWNVFQYSQVQWLKTQGFCGWAVWTLDYDDFSGTFCSGGTYPLIKALNTALGGSRCVLVTQLKLISLNRHSRNFAFRILNVNRIKCCHLT